jgi:hypothetical protein
MKKKIDCNRFISTDEDLPGIIILKKADVNSKLMELAERQVALRNQSGPSEDGSLFEEIRDNEIAILKRFGLPEIPRHLEIVQFETLPDEVEIERRIQLLKEIATEYIMSEGTPDLRLLKKAIIFDYKVANILPELKILLHIYTIYVYNVILFKRKDTVENVLEELRFVNREPEILGLIGQMSFAYIPDDIYSRSEGCSITLQPDIHYTLDDENKYVNIWEIVNLLEEKGVKYIRRFIVSQSCVVDDDDY